jgi:hypothetical protein
MHAGDLQDLDVLHPALPERLGHGLRRAADLRRRIAGGGDAGDPGHLDEGREEIRGVPVEVVEGGFDRAVGRGHESSGDLKKRRQAV